MTFLSMATFRSSLLSLCRRPRDGYHSCKTDICHYFKELSFDDIWCKPYLIHDSADIRIIKIRLPISCQNLSSANGFRLIICCNRKYQSVIFLNLYPKRGKLGMLDQSPTEYKRQLKEYATSFKADSMVVHDISKDLSTA